jgi:hypothetical protein
MKNKYLIIQCPAKFNHLFSGGFKALKKPIDNKATTTGTGKTPKGVFLFLLMFITITAFSQANYTVPKNVELKSKIEAYEQAMKKADGYEIKTEMEFQLLESLRTEAHRYMDSARAISWKAKKDISKASIYVQKLNLFVGFTSSCLKKADSALILANIYKDSAYIKDKEAEDICFALSLGEKVTENQQGITYVVQLGAGNNLDPVYFDKAADVKVIKLNDGIKRYVVGIFNTKDEAKACKQKMIQLGYTDAFVRTMESLYQ